MSTSALRAAAAAGLLAAVLSASPAAAFVQTCAGNPPVCLKWPTRNITWKINTCRPSSSASCRASGSVDPVIDVAKTSFQTWQSASCTDLTFTYGGTTGSILAGADTNEHVIVFRQGWCSENPDARGDPCFTTATCGNKFDCFDDQGGLGRSTLALTSVSYRTDGTIVDSDTEIVDWDGGTGQIDTQTSNGIYVTCYAANPPAAQCTSYGQADCVYYDLQNTLTHEIGHFIGIAHPCGSGSGGISCSGNFSDLTMYPFESPGETKKRDLAQDDIDAICTIYPRGAALSAGAVSIADGAVSLGTVQAAASGAGAACIAAPKKSGCATGGEGLAATTLLALLAARLRRRRGASA